MKMEKKKEEILSRLLVKKEDTLKDLEELVDLAAKFIRVENESGDVFFINNQGLTNKDRVVLLLIGKFFSKELNLATTQSLNLGEMSDQLNVPGTTLSKPIGILVEERIIRKEEDGKYSMIHHKIKDYLKIKTQKR
jgi:DNA-binding transcriptional ArsR family regulator